MNTKMTIENNPFSLTRRTFVTGITTSGALLTLGSLAHSSYAQNRAPLTPRMLKGKVFDLSIDYQGVNFTGKERIATTVNNSLPAPTLVWKEGDRVTLRVKNNLATDSSIHWHGIILPTEMDGVPKLSFSGIKPNETFEYSFDVKQSGTYWYHSHSAYQEQLGVYGAIIIEPKAGKADAYDRDHVVVLSDWSDERPENIYKKLKKLPHYYNTKERTLNDLYHDIKNKGVANTWNERLMWNQMRMSDRDISDITGSTYTFLMNGNTPQDNWIGLFNNGEKVRLRFINAAAMTIFDVRIAGLKMTVVASDGQDIKPVSIDEFRIGVAETYDVIVEPEADSAYTIFAQAIDRSGYARGTLTPSPSLKAMIPDLDPMPILGHEDMGMTHTADSMASMNHGDHSMHMASSMRSGVAGYGSSKKIIHKKI